MYITHYDGEKIDIDLSIIPRFDNNDIEKDKSNWIHGMTYLDYSTGAIRRYYQDDGWRTVLRGGFLKKMRPPTQQELLSVKYGTNETPPKKITILTKIREYFKREPDEYFYGIWMERIALPMIMFLGTIVLISSCVAICVFLLTELKQLF